METLECPYCGKYIEIEPDEHYNGTEEYTCRLCGKNFEVYAEPMIEYTAQGKAPCLNGESHKWKQIMGAPQIHYQGKYRCEWCSAEYTNKDEIATNEDWRRYFDEE